MAISTIKLLDTMEWAKKFNFGRSSAQGNFLEPAIMSANIVLQTMLGPPFNWYWNNQEVHFSLNPVTTVRTLTTTSLTANVATYTTSVAHGYNAGQFVTVTGSTHNSVFNVIDDPILAVTSNTFTVAITNADIGSASDTGTVTLNFQDYQIAVSNFNTIEHSSVQDPATGNWTQMDTKMNLSLDSAQARPRYVAPHSEDGNGNVTFRFMPTPDKAYNVEIHIQKTAPLFTQISQTWSPMPDHYSYIYNWGFLAMMWLFADDPRFPIANQKFVAHLLGAAEGLTETERNIFLNNWNALSSVQQQQQSQGIQSRAV